jgi:hypothetical protein
MSLAIPKVEGDVTVGLSAAMRLVGGMTAGAHVTNYSYAQKASKELRDGRYN